MPRSTIQLARLRAGREAGSRLSEVRAERPSMIAPEGPATHAQWYEPIEPIAAWLRHHGLERGSHVLIFSETRREWFQADLAIIAAGGITVPSYPNLPPGQVERIISHCRPTHAFVSRAAHLEDLLRAPSAAGCLRTVVLMEGNPVAGSPESDARSAAVGIERSGPLAPSHQNGLSGFPRVVSWEQARAEGAALEAELREVDGLLRALDLDDPATLIFTSGTSGEMKGVLLTHGNLLYSARVSAELLEVNPADVYLSFLPLNHVLERVVHLSMLHAGAVIHYSQGLDQLEQEFRRVRPTIVVGVPRLYEKILLEIEQKARARGPRGLLLLRLAERAARRSGRLAPGRRPGGLAGGLWNLLVYRRVRGALGGRVRCLVSGGAPLGRREALFLNGAGLPVLEGYGLTETASVLSLNTVKNWRLGSVGKPMPGIEVAIAEDGEILVRGPSVMAGYRNGASGDNDTGSSRICDGWLYTGDLGRLDAEGFLYITERKKDLIATTQGKMVAPQAVEACLRRSPLVREAVVVGDRRPYITALIFPELDRLRALSGLLLAPNGDLEKSLNAPKVRTLIQQEMDLHCADLAPHERVRRFALLPEAPNVGNGEMTASLKIRREKVAQRYAAVIASLYR